MFHLKITNEDIKNLAQEVLSKYEGEFEYSNNEDAFEINTMESLNHVEQTINLLIIGRHIKNNVYFENRMNVIIGSKVKIAPYAMIGNGVTIIGNSEIGACKIGSYSYINNSIIEDNAIVLSSYVIDSKICKNATFGPFSHARMNTVIGENDRVGNFVELKNSTLGIGTKAAHLTYIGDANVGDNVNFGCGTITANYDGVNKHKTVIGDNVFIGSNSNLIAPVEIKDNSFIAAGTTVTKNVDENKFVISRPELKIKEKR